MYSVFIMKEENSGDIWKYRKYRYTKNCFLNFLKGCGCIGVVFIHVPFHGLAGKIVDQISSFAVPIFFMISGYFAYSTTGDASQKIIRRTKRICKVFFGAIALYTAYILCICIKQQCVGQWLSEFLDWKQWIKILVMGDLDLFCGFHLWFLHAQIIAYIILLFIEKKFIHICLSKYSISVYSESNRFYGDVYK